MGMAWPLFAADYFVDKSGNDGNTGTRMQPFITIQKAASLMQPGDVCLVSKGIYRETVRPARSGKPGAPLIFQAAPGESVAIGGADEITDWQRFSGPVYRTRVGTAIQILVDEVPAVRLPVIPSASLEPKAAWYHDPAGGFVYLRLPHNDGPESHHIGIQTRAWGLDAGGRSHIELKGFNLKACGVNLAGTRMCRLNDCHLWWGGGRASLTNAVSGMTNPVPFLAAILLGGKENEVINTSVIGNTGFGLAMLTGSLNNCLENSLFRGTENPIPGAVGILAQGTAPLIRNVSVMDYEGGALVCRDVLNARIESNDFHHIGRGGTNISIICLAGDGKGTVLASNWIHDNAAPGGTGIRMAGPVENYVVRQNVVWGQSGAAIGMTAPSRYNFIFNNTCAGNGCGMDGEPGDGDFHETRIINNILQPPVWPSRGGEPPVSLVWKNNYTGVTPGFVDAANHNFKLATGSPCIDAGQEEPEFTDEFSGKLPDMGAYEFGRDYPVPGCHVNESANKVMPPLVKLIMESGTEGADIRYTLDGRDPDLTSQSYTGAIPVIYGAIVKVRAFREGMEESSTAGMQVRTME